MSSIVYIYHQYLAKEWIQSNKKLKLHDVVFKGNKLLLLSCLLSIFIAKVNAQEVPVNLVLH